MLFGLFTTDSLSDSLSSLRGVHFVDELILSGPPRTAHTSASAIPVRSATTATRAYSLRLLYRDSVNSNSRLDQWIEIRIGHRVGHSHPRQNSATLRFTLYLRFGFHRLFEWLRRRRPYCRTRRLFISVKRLAHFVSGFVRWCRNFLRQLGWLTFTFFVRIPLPCCFFPFTSFFAFPLFFNATCFRLSDPRHFFPFRYSLFELSTLWTTKP